MSSSTTPILLHMSGLIENLPILSPMIAIYNVLFQPDKIRRESGYDLTALDWKESCRNVNVTQPQHRCRNRAGVSDHEPGEGIEWIDKISK